MDDAILSSSPGISVDGEGHDGGDPHPGEDDGGFFIAQRIARTVSLIWPRRRCPPESAHRLFRFASKENMAEFFLIF
jgi:hypothetical protein